MDLFGRPTIINNVETLAAVPLDSLNMEMLTGGNRLDANPRLVDPASFGVKLMGVSGHVNNPDVFEAELGITLSVRLLKIMLVV